jgi:dipeptidyl aminopeptidase/acylaminoacyl peptidase
MTLLHTIEYWQSKSFPGSPIAIEQLVAETAQYSQYVTCYYSDGLRISALLTVPKGSSPPDGWPVLIWNHGGADPKKFDRQSDNHVGKQFASKGYVTFQPAYRGYAGSDGDPTDELGPAVDSVNAIASIKQYPGVDSSRIGVGGHSMGGTVTLHDVIISKDIKAAVTVAGTFVPLGNLIEQAAQVASTTKLSTTQQERWKPIEEMIDANGSPSANPEFWAQYDFMAHLSDVSAPMQIHHGLKDPVVPWQQSQQLYESLQRLNKPAELHTYPEVDHQTNGYSQEAFPKMVEFLDRYLKN